MHAPPEPTPPATREMDSRPRGDSGAEAQAQASDASAPSRPQRERRVLLVDDERFILASLSRLLRCEPYEVLTASGGAQALKLMEEHSFQLIVSDQCMPEMTGLELMRKVRDRWPSTIRIILSGYTEVNTLLAAMNDGAIYKFITKPWNDEELRLHIRRAIEQYELQTQNHAMEREIISQNAKLRELNEDLDQRAADAAVGLNFAQELLEAVNVGVVGVDESGLIVWANRQGHEIISSGRPELIGMPAEIALPKPVYELACTAGIPNGDAASSRIRLDRKMLQCRVNPLVASAGYRGCVIALWEDVG